MPGPYSVSVAAADVGARVSLRRLLRDGREGFGDVVGELLRWDDETVVIRRRDGAEVVVARGDVVAAKRLPPALPRRAPRGVTGTAGE